MLCGSRPSAPTERGSSRRRGTRPPASGMWRQERQSRFCAGMSLTCFVLTSTPTERRSSRRRWMGPPGSGMPRKARKSWCYAGMKVRWDLPASALTDRGLSRHRKTRPSGSGMPLPGTRSRSCAATPISVPSAAFSPDGSRIVSASFDNTARVWDAATGLELEVLRGHQSWVNLRRLQRRWIADHHRII